MEKDKATMEALINAQPQIEVDLNMGSDIPLEKLTNSPENPRWLRQVWILFRRNIREESRRLDLFFTALIQGILMSIVIAFAFFQIGTSQTSIVRREPVLFFSILNQGVFAALNVINAYPFERTLTLRERACGAYFASSYFIAKLLCDLIVQLPVPVIFVSIYINI